MFKSASLIRVTLRGIANLDNLCYNEYVKNMANTNKKIPTLLLAIAVSASLLAGYFCFTPNIAQAVSNMSYASNSSSDQSNFFGCQDATTPGHYRLFRSSSANSVPPCCLEKNDNNQQSGAINLNNLSLDNTNQQPPFQIQIINNDSADHSTSFDYPISPTQTGISSSIILIE